MSETQEYRVRGYVNAERIPEDGTVFLSTGQVFGREGDYLVHTDKAVLYFTAATFEAVYELVPESVSAARKFTPYGETVETVLEFFRDNPDEVERVKKLESENGSISRKGIMEYEIR